MDAFLSLSPKGVLVFWCFDIGCREENLFLTLCRLVCCLVLGLGR